MAACITNTATLSHYRHSFISFNHLGKKSTLPSTSKTCGRSSLTPSCYASQRLRLSSSRQLSRTQESGQILNGVFDGLQTSGCRDSAKKRTVICGYSAEPPPRPDFDPSAPPYEPEDDPVEIGKRLQVSKRLERTANYFARLGVFGFWGQLVCTVVSAVILAFSIVITGKATAPATFYLTTGGIVAAFLSVFWSFGYTRLSERLRETISNPTKAPPRSQVVRNLTNGLIINLIGMGATLLGMQATVGTLVAKALTSSAQPFVQGVTPGYSPVLALDVFLVQASANTLLSHFFGLILTLELLRAVTQSQPPPENVIPKAA